MTTGSETEELLNLHSSTVAEIEFFKRQQWQVAYYGAIANAAVVAAWRLISAGLTFPGYFLALTIAGVLAFTIWRQGLVLLECLQAAITERRNRLRRIREDEQHISNAFRNARGAKPEQPDQVLPLLRTTFWIGALLVTTILGSDAYKHMSIGDCP